MLALKPAYGEKDRAAVIRNICDSKAKPLRQIENNIPRDLETITMKAIAGDPADRYASAREFGDDLQRFLTGKPIVARPVSHLESGLEVGFATSSDCHIVGACAWVVAVGSACFLADVARSRTRSRPCGPRACRRRSSRSKSGERRIRSFGTG